MVSGGIYNAAEIKAEEPHNWTGLYFGADMGYGDADFKGVAENGAGSAAFAEKLDLSGGAFGAHAGLNCQFPSALGSGRDIVLGLEGDISALHWRDDFLSNSADEGLVGRVNLLGSVRARLGIPIGDFLYYLTGGIAFTDARAGSHRDTNNIVYAMFNNVGGVFGGGAAWAINETISHRAEGLYYIFNDRKNAGPGTGFPAGAAGDFLKFDDAFVGRVGINFKIGNVLQ